ncbi:MAG TPA: helix-hairpin-helix domain-containing protein [Mariniphaga sp.]|nr:helix-hairpin-helix domain-containing protein [Mariniphaga sp.]
MKKDRNGMIVLLALILISVLGHIFIRRIEFLERFDYSEWLAEMEERNQEQVIHEKREILFNFDPNKVAVAQLDSLDFPREVKQNIIRYREAGGKFFKAADIRKIYGMNDSLYAVIEPYLVFPKQTIIDKAETAQTIKKSYEGTFDPNTAGKDILNEFGLNEFQASNILRYREHGGKFEKKEHLLKIYGFDSLTLEMLDHNIKIERPDSTKSELSFESNPIIELNSADSASLVRLKGIGPVFAVRILRYRELLGGFCSTDQLLEVYGFPLETYEVLTGKLTVDTLRVKKIRLNFAEFAEMIRHPYFNKEQVKSLLDHRQLNGPFKNKEQLITNKLIDSLSFKRLAPYITCR